MMYLFYIYVFFAFVWGIYSVEMQHTYHPDSLEWWRLILIFIVNIIIFPIAVIISIYKKKFP